MQARLIVVDEHAGGDVHGIHETESLADTTLTNRCRHFPSDVLEPHSLIHVHSQVLGLRFQTNLLCRTR